VRPAHIPQRRQQAGRRLAIGLLLVLGLAGLAVASGAAGTAASAAGVPWSPAHPGDFPDPSVLHYGGTYYAFATQNYAPHSQTVNIQLSTSTDGVTWTASPLDALPHLPAWAQIGDTWAPTVAYNGSEFVMYYSATLAPDGGQCIGQAVSSTPEGPYVDDSTAPFLCQSGGPDLGGSIDPDIFVDPGGGATLIWKSDGNRIGLTSSIWSEPLSPDLLSATGSPTLLLSSDQAWQGGIIEGPDMVDEGGTDYLFYAGSAYASSSYAIGYAVCAGGPAAPCTDGGANPILTTGGGLSGPGGPSDFLSPSGQVELAFSAWQGSTIGYMQCGIRPMYVAALTIGPGGVPAIAPATAPGAAVNPTCAQPGYWQVGADGGVFTFGSAQFYGSTGSLRLNRPVVGMAATPDGRGYWLVASDGGVFAFGDARFFGSTGGIALNKPIVGLVPSPEGGGYWLVASDGGVFAFGDAAFEGSLGADPPSTPITAMAPGAGGGGYWVADSAGQVFTFGDVSYDGDAPWSVGGARITGMSTTADGGGYWLASADGAVTGLGDAVYFGSLAGVVLNAPMVGIATTADGGGYWLQGADGGIFSFGDAEFLGSMGGRALNAPMVGVASV
jgi:hypothetical protein